MGLAKYAEDNYEIMLDRLSTRMMYGRGEEANFFNPMGDRVQFSPEYRTLPDVEYRQERKMTKLKMGFENFRRERS